MRGGPVLALALAFVVVATSDAIGATKPEVKLQIQCSASGKLIAINLGGRHISDPTNPANEQLILASVPKKTSRLLITNTSATPYRCIGALVYTPQSYGYQNITFIAEPPD